ncbi:hypothetical protein [Tengunoibacter tsumagoiensis]|uniref:Uncharacterized protein n=1 Tax=Tengunoibacter tsumagoiensis TaxID=2014871 RepID=A0A401ZVG7_9CHLR|nr:hypothetical protein [Tengunoibacter tsumagoiensis]GCE10786.1 hypothetical protein KTT_06450 [Tengunoibacter tsumagoiensis]
MRAELPTEIQQQLAGYGIQHYGEIELREELEARIQTYTLFKLADWPARRWKCRYRLMMGEGMYDAQSVPEAYARGLLAILQSPDKSASTQETGETH